MSNFDFSVIKANIIKLPKSAIVMSREDFNNFKKEQMLNSCVNDFYTKGEISQCSKDIIYRNNSIFAVEN